MAIAKAAKAQRSLARHLWDASARLYSPNAFGPLVRALEALIVFVDGQAAPQRRSFALAQLLSEPRPDCRRASPRRPARALLRVCRRSSAAPLL